MDAGADLATQAMKRRISDEFVCSPECPVCRGEGIVCEDHPATPWNGGDPPCCGRGAGAPCPSIAIVRRRRGPSPLDGPYPTRTLEAGGEPDRHPYLPHPADDWLRAQLGRQ
jgi:hypothetical protein